MDTARAVELLRQMVRIPSVSRDEGRVAGMLGEFFAAQGLRVDRFGCNLLVRAAGFDPRRPVVMLNSHIDTVRPSPSYTFDPFAGDGAPDMVRGLGSNDAGASVVALSAAFLRLAGRDLCYSPVLALSTEEEVGGENGMRLLLPSMASLGVVPAMALVGEPTDMAPAVAERGLVVLDCETAGISGHAARDEGVNAIYRAMADIDRLRSFQFPKVSPTLGPLRISVTQIEAGRQHNVVPDLCRWVVDVRTTDAYSNEDTVAILRGALSPWTSATPRSTRVRASVIDPAHPLVAAAVACGAGEPFVSPTTSDMSLLGGIPSLKIGPGRSSRSHTADEFVLVGEIASAIDLYEKILLKLDKILRN
ncbi:MAG: M20/M25/M40 family metallo-hydrolase [Clostridium sp.]|nr:M20/M25/M40 family metallo-hydrolase [Clostridium sp.]